LHEEQQVNIWEEPESLRERAMKMNEAACEAMARAHPERDLLARLRKRLEERAHREEKRQAGEKQQAEIATRRNRQRLEDKRRAKLDRWVARLCATPPGEGPERKLIKDIVREVATLHQLEPAALTGSARGRPIVLARHEAIYRCAAERADLSFVIIGRLFGGRDHSTIIHAIRGHANRLKLPMPRGMSRTSSKDGRRARAKRIAALEAG
jgi:hypothetical protein